MKKGFLKLVSVAVLAVLVMSLAGCGGATDSKVTPSAGGGSAVTPLTEAEVKAAQTTYDSLIDAIVAVDTDLAGKYIDTGSLMSVSVDDLEGGDVIIESVFSKLSSETVSCVQSGHGEVEITSNLTTIDLTGVLGYCTQIYKEELEAGKISDENSDARIEEIFKEEIVKEDLPTVTSQVKVKVKLVGNEWKVQLNDEFQNAISGNFIGSVKEAQGAN